MVAVCDSKCDISSYFSEPSNPDEYDHRRRLQPLNSSPRMTFTGSFGSLDDWKCNAIGLLDMAAEEPWPNWHLCNTMQRIVPTCITIKVAPDLEHKFGMLAEQWRTETAHLSSIEMIAMHPAYQRIIGMGPDALPLILSELSREPEHWFWALYAITGENPVEPKDAGNLAQMAEAWLELGRKRRWI